MELMEAMQTSEKDEVVELSEPPAKKSKNSAIHFLLGDTVASVETGSMTCLEEMEYFRKEPVLGLESDVFEWWRKNQEMFPHLSDIARKLLCIPATSVPSERIFSVAGGIVTKKRTNLKPENVDMLVFLNKNLPPI
uniref:HAT C-terminal dimerisation domain-containing protein n=1 Tax=Amphimedon queenslandica TaxID=400682 RepID=A0A1X7SR93_AMPQE